jgi:hypothetical protein
MTPLSDGTKTQTIHHFLSIFALKCNPAVEQS